MTELADFLPASGWHRLAADAAWQGFLVGGLALLVTRVWRERPAARAGVALLAVVLCVVAPVVSAVARGGGWGWLRAPAVAEPVAAIRDLAPRDVAPTVAAANPIEPRVAAPAPAPTAASPIMTAEWAWQAFGLVWLVLSCFLALRLARSALAVRRACRGAEPCRDAAIHAALARACEALAVDEPRLCTTSAIASPALVTWGRPRLLLPAESQNHTDWFAVFAHELGHLVRRDGWSRLAIELVATVLPWQPAAWLLRRAFRSACEEACDDWAVAAGADPVEFAALLTDFLPQRGGALALGMSESVPVARRRILRLLTLHSVPRPRLGRVVGIAGWVVAAALAIVLALLQRGGPWGGGNDLPPWGKEPASVAAAHAPPAAERPPLKPYRVDTPDVLLIDAVKVVPKAPYHIEPLDTLLIAVLGTLPGEPITGPHPVEAEGTIHLGPSYGDIKVSGMTIAESREAIKKHLEDFLTAPEVSVALYESSGKQQISAEHLIGPDGTVNLGTYGTVYVAGMTVEEVRKAIEAHLEQYLEAPEISIDVYAYNSKVYYVIADRGGNSDVSHYSCTGNERVLDALSKANGLQLSRRALVWIARPTPTEAAKVQILPVDWRAIFRGESNATNYWIEPGDRVFVRE